MPTAVTPDSEDEKGGMALDPDDVQQTNGRYTVWVYESTDPKTARIKRG